MTAPTASQLDLEEAMAVGAEVEEEEEETEDLGEQPLQWRLGGGGGRVEVMEKNVKKGQ